MTREEAIKYIKQHKMVQCGTCVHQQEGVLCKKCGFPQAIDMAIEALSADAVSREFYEDAVKANIGLVIENRQLKEQIESADAEQGEWEFVDNEIFAGEYFCSICGKRAEVDLYGEWILSNYCPSCGARMKGGAE